MDLTISDKIGLLCVLHEIFKFQGLNERIWMFMDEVICHLCI